MLDSIVCVSAGGVSVYLSARMTRSEAQQSVQHFLCTCVPSHARNAAVAAGLLGAVANVVTDVGHFDWATKVEHSQPMQLHAGGPKVKNNEYQINVTTMTSKIVHALRVSSSTTVEDLKGMIQNVVGTPVDYQRLIYSGKQMEDGLSLGHYNVQQNHEIMLVLRMRGC